MFCLATFMSSSLGFSSSCSTHAPERTLAESATARAAARVEVRKDAGKEVRKDVGKEVRMRAFYRWQAAFANSAIDARSCYDGAGSSVRTLLIVPGLFGTELHDAEV